MQKITASIITLNEEGTIRRCLESLSWIDEIVVVDSGSTDQTVKICQEYTSKVIVHEWEGYGRQKNYCADLASNDWIFNIDADEVVDCFLQKEIERIRASSGLSGVYKIGRKNFVKNIWIQHGSWYPDFIVRLYDRRACRFTKSKVHEALEPQDPCTTLTGHLEHYSYSGLNDYFFRLNRYALLSSEEMIMKNKKFFWSDLICRPPLNFIKNYILKKGFLDGYYGFSLACGHALYTFQKYALLWENEVMKKEKSPIGYL